MHPNHPMAEKSEEERGMSVPVMLHLDDGRGLKKAPFFVCSWQLVIGRNTAMNYHESTKTIHDSDACMTRSMQHNMSGHALETRFLYSVMHHKFSTPGRTNEILEQLAAEMLELHDHGLNAGDLGKYFLVCIGCKGDTPALVKAGVSRSFYNMAKRGQNTNGICWLCKAGQFGFDFEDVRWDAPWTRTRGEETGVKPNYPLQAIPKTRDFPESFFRPDPFHNGKLGVGQDWVAGCVLHLADMKMFADAGYDPQMAIATDMFRDFCRRNKFSPTFKAFTQESFLAQKMVAYFMGPPKEYLLKAIMSH